MTAVLTTLLGGLLAIAGGLVGIALGDRRERSRWPRDSQWQASINLLSALQLLVRRMGNVAYLDEKQSSDPSSAAVASFGEATVAWNSAIYSALLITPPAVAAEIPELDREVDRLLDLAVSRRWKRGEFRAEPIRLGRMAAEYLRRARRIAGLPDIELPSIWAWDEGSDRPGSGHQSPERPLAWLPEHGPCEGWCCGRSRIHDRCLLADHSAEPVSCCRIATRCAGQSFADRSLYTDRSARRT